MTNQPRPLRHLSPSFSRDPWATEAVRQKRKAERQERRKLLLAVAKLMVAAAAFYTFFGW